MGFDYKQKKTPLERVAMLPKKIIEIDFLFILLDTFR